MALLDDMMILQAWSHAMHMGTHENTPDGWRVFCERMDRCVLAVEKLARLVTPQQYADACDVQIGDRQIPDTQILDALEGDRPPARCNVVQLQPNVICFPAARTPRSEEAQMIRVLKQMAEICSEDDGGAA